MAARDYTDMWAAGRLVLLGKLDTLFDIEAFNAALRSMFELKDAKGASVDLFFGPTAPEGKDKFWLQTLPDRGWFTYFRIYGPEQTAFDGGWKPGDFERVG